MSTGADLDIRNRIQRFLDSKGMRVQELAERIGVQRSSISHIMSGRNKPSFDLISKFLNAFPEISAEWFITGKGSMYKKPVQQALFPEHIVREENGEDITEAGTSDQAHHDTSVEEAGQKKREGDARDRVTNLPEAGRMSRLERIVLFFEDGTFREYKSR